MIEVGNTCKGKLDIEKSNKKIWGIHINLLDTINTQGQPYIEIDYEKYIIKVYEHFIEDL